jgi:hypothetical protein
MQPAPLLWPFPWWTVGAAVVVVIGVPWLIARARVIRRNRELARLGHQLHQLGITQECDPFAIGDRENVLVVTTARLAVSDVKNARVVQTLTLSEARSLKIYDHRSNLIEFRLVINGGAQTRKIATASIAGFGRLFGLLGREGKPVEYIQS